MPGDRRFGWKVEGECHHPNSTPEYRPVFDSGTIRAEGAGEVLERIVTGKGVGDNAINWDVVDQSRPIVISIWPV